MDRDRSLESRLSRVEERAARLEERINAERETRRAWDQEVQRRLGELNNHAAQLEAERIHFLSKETYEARHAELNALLESRARELTNENKSLLDKTEVKIEEHTRIDSDLFERHGHRLGDIETWIANMKGRFWALGVGLTVLSVLIQFLIHAIFK